MEGITATPQAAPSFPEVAYLDPEKFKAGLKTQCETALAHAIEAHKQIARIGPNQE
jgi:hypothetical protein